MLDHETAPAAVNLTTLHCQIDLRTPRIAGDDTNSSAKERIHLLVDLYCFFTRPGRTERVLLHPQM